MYPHLLPCAVDSFACFVFEVVFPDRVSMCSLTPCGPGTVVFIFHTTKTAVAAATRHRAIEIQSMECEYMQVWKPASLRTDEI